MYSMCNLCVVYFSINSNKSKSFYLKLLLSKEKEAYTIRTLELGLRASLKRHR